ncbi:hypothetical protein J1TS5_09940 [Paenibacillus macerans]|uniref:hypothetical protein n=1 Tax=Paenibacillus macerans TaxID=44252 RepID=UPI001B2F5AB1|nr:hypothetical protein [Paenibacillus macerans]GIP08824.1 hypothetical protein J1TS5_09940 [Paenibacillus macerans]
MSDAINLYEISYTGYFDDCPDYSVLKKGNTPGAAKYAAFLEFSDCDPDITFIDYLKIVRVRKIGQSEPLPGEPPFREQHRIDIVNEIIREIGRRGRRFLYSIKHDRFAYFFGASNKLWLMDDYTGELLLMDKSMPGEHYHFSHGGTLWGLMCDFRDYINGDDDANHNNGYCGLYCGHWGYPDEDMQAIRQKAIELGYLRPASMQI